MQTPVYPCLEAIAKDAPCKDTMPLQQLTLAVILSAGNSQVVSNIL
jgi:hypothetical protein